VSAEALPTASARRFSAPAILLHWTIAALILFNLYLGLRQDAEESVIARFEILQLHKSIGITVLALSVLRLIWRFMNPPPPYPASMKGWEKAVASLTHWSFYGLMIGLPLLGWVIVSASVRNIPTLLYQAIPWPHLPGLMELPIETRRQITEVAGGAHGLLAWIAMALIVLHVAAALKHQFVTKDGVLYRMAPLPFFRPRA
jgi:cytochrome b561